MNVALTRARFVLVVVGNSPTLTVDRNWRKFIDFVAARGGYYKCVNQKIDFFTNKVWHDMLSAPER
jgi:superfamily I DNA and/or RNA helicase